MTRKSDPTNANNDSAGSDASLVQVQGDLARQVRILHALGASSPDFIYVFDLEHRFIYASQPLLRLWGKSLAEVLGKNFEDLGYSSELVDLHRGQIQEALTGKTVSGANAYVNAQGVEGQYEYTFVPVAADDGSIESVVGTTRDITARVTFERERSAALSALQGSELQLRQFADSLPQLAWKARSDGHIFWYNQRWYEYTGTTEQEMQGWGWQRVHDPATLPTVLEQWKKSLASGNPFEMSFPLRGADGQFRLFLTRVLPIRNTTGEVVLWLGTNTDIHAHHQALVERDAALVSANEANRAKDEFLAMLGHELRNPLAPIVTALKLLQMRGALGREYEVIERQVKHLSRLVDDLLDVARITQGRVELRRAQIDARAAIHNAVEIASPLIEQRSQKLRLDLPAYELPLTADAERLAQVVSNLLTNASKFSAPGSKISVHGERTGDVIRIKVRDQGVGIPADMLEDIFGNFIQQRQSIERSGGGLGLGLSIAKNLVELHGGSVHAVSEGPGTGAEFIVELPATPLKATVASTHSKDKREATGLASEHRRRVLIVDDNQDAAELLAEFMSSLGFIVQVAYDPPAALALAVDFQPHIALLDIGLPIMDGWELGRRLRTLLSANAKLIAVTGYGQERDRRLSNDSGFAGHLVKPVDLDTLSKIVCV